MEINEDLVNSELPGFQGCAARSSGVEPLILTANEKSHDPLVVSGNSGMDLPEFLNDIGRTIMVRKILVWVLMWGYMSALTACNTFEGMGKDVERGGEHVQDAAKDVKKKM
jgi:entericidin B